MKKLTQEYVYQKIKEKEITLISKYKNTRTKVSVKCDVCGYEWDTQTNVLLNTKCGCPKCFGNAKKTTTTFISELEKINPNITILGEYINNKSPISSRYSTCNVLEYKEIYGIIKTYVRIMLLTILAN